MVIKAPPNTSIPNANRKSPTSSITNIASLKRYNDRDYALDLLHQMAKAAAPLIHEYGFKVGTLCEMYPKNPSLLGLNVNRGQKILIRLRTPFNDRSFYPMGDLMGTFLHELTHNVHGPHDAKFYLLLDELKRKFESGNFAVSDYVCEESKLGSGFSAPWKSPQSIRDKRIQALGKGIYKAERQRLGGSSLVPMGALREAALRAAERRLKDSKWCPLADLTSKEVEDLTSQPGESSSVIPETAEDVSSPSNELKVAEYVDVVDLTQQDVGDEPIEVIEIDACDKSDENALAPPKWPPSFSAPLPSNKSEVPAGNALEPTSRIFYKHSRSPGRTFSAEFSEIYPRRKLVADLGFEQIIEWGATEKQKSLKAAPEAKRKPRSKRQPRKSAKAMEEKRKKEVRAVTFEEIINGKEPSPA